MPADLPTLLPTPPEAVFRRLALQALVIRSVWFPTRNDIRAWDHSGCPVYMRPIRPDHFEVGPRLGAMWASVFSPVWSATLHPEGNGTRVTWQRRLPGTTTAVLGIWAVILLVWGGVVLTGGAPNSAPWWALLALGTASAPIVGRIRGGRALDEAEPWLRTVLLMPDDEEDW